VLVDFLYLQAPMLCIFTWLLTPWSFAYSCYIVATPMGHGKQTGNRNTSDHPKKFCQTELNTWKWIDLSKMGERERRKQYDSRKSGKKLNIQTNGAACLLRAILQSGHLSTRLLPICFALMLERTARI
jgi:hypothetical protein